MLKLVAYKETAADEQRVAITPDAVKKYAALEISCFIEKEAGKQAGYSNADYKAAGATLFEAGDLGPLRTADIVIGVQPDVTTGAAYSKKACVIGMLKPGAKDSPAAAFNKKKLAAFSLELLPRITRAQSMDVLSSQSNLAGYKAVIDAVNELPVAVPMMTTAAGSIKPAHVLVIGAGVAGLQAIATAKRLGAKVSAFDVRAAAKEQVESLGAAFVEVESDEDLESKAGYAKEASEEYKKRQAEALAQSLPKQDIIITTALIPGRPAPEIITAEMVKTLKDGAVVVDLAAPAGGNVAGTQLGKTVKKAGVTFIGHSNTASRLAKDASMLLANNFVSFITNLVKNDERSVEINLNDEIISGTLLCQNGEMVHPLLAEKAPPKKAAASKAKKAPAARKSKATATKTASKSVAKKPAVKKATAAKKTTAKKPATRKKSVKKS